MDYAELVGGPDGEDDEEDEAGKIHGAASAQTGLATDVDHADVSKPHGEGEKNLGVAEVTGTDRDLSYKGADEQAGGHAGKAEQKGFVGDLVDGFERRQPSQARGFLFEAALLNEIEKGRKEAEEERSVGGQQKCYMEEDPDAAVDDKPGSFAAGVEGRDEAENEDDRQDEDAKGDGFEAQVDEQEGGGEYKGEEYLEFVDVDRQAVVGCVEHLGQGDEVEEEGCGGGGDSQVAPAGAVVERDRENGKRGNAVEENRDSEPEDRHR